MSDRSMADLETDLRAAVKALHERLGDWTTVGEVVGRVVGEMVQQAGGASTPREEALDEAAAPQSVPADLTDEQREHLRALLRKLYAKRGAWYLVATDVGYRRRFIEAFVKGQVQGSMHFAAGVARAAGVELEDALAGRGS